jgi:hypothetical protein
MPCNCDGYGDPLGDVISARDQAAAVACECIKAMLTNDGYDLHDLPPGAEAWFRGHRGRDKQKALTEAREDLARLHVKPKELIKAESLKEEGFVSTVQKQAELDQIETEWRTRFQAGQAKVQAIYNSDPMDLKHGLY